MIPGADRAPSPDVSGRGAVGAPAAPRVLGYASPGWDVRPPWWRGSVWDWLGSIILVLLAFFLFWGLLFYLFELLA